MYCSLGQNQFFDDAGVPLSAGRVKIYAKGSDTLLPIYEDNGDGFVPAQNPVITANDGRIPTVFWPAALVDVVVEKSNGDGTYTELDSYVAGLDLSTVEAVQGVGSIAELRSIMPSENMVVQVNGYYTAGDSPTRKYLWVAGASNFDDGGYVIRSNRDYNGGRWLMIWEGEFLPASLYGVFPGVTRGAETYTKKIANLSNLFNFSGIGYFTNGIFIETPKTILFDRSGYYDIGGGTYTTNRKIASVIGASSVTDYGYVLADFPIIHCAGFEKYDGHWGTFQARFYPDDTTYGKEGTVPSSLFPDVSTFVTGATQSWGTIIEIEASCSFSFGSYLKVFSKTVVDYTSYGIAAPSVTDTGSTYINPVTGTVRFGGDLYSGGRVTMTGIELHSGTESHGGTVVFSGTLTSSGNTELHTLKWLYNSESYDSGLRYLVNTSATVGTRAVGMLNIVGPLSFKSNARVLLPSTSDVDMAGSWASDYEDGEMVIIVNNSGSNTININGLGPSDSASMTISNFCFAMFMKYNGHWYSER